MRDHYVKTLDTVRVRSVTESLCRGELSQSIRKTKDSILIRAFLFCAQIYHLSAPQTKRRPQPLTTL